MPKKKKDGPHPQMSFLEELEEVPRTKGETPAPKKKRKATKKSTRSTSSGTKKGSTASSFGSSKSKKSTKKKAKKRKRDVRLSTTQPKANRNILEREYKGFQVWVSDKEGRDANKTMATIEGDLGSYVMRVYLRLDDENDTIKVAKAARAIIDRLKPDKKEDKDG